MAVKTDAELERTEDGKRRSCPESNGNGRKQWKKPELEDVSGKIMAQPYIRFT